MRIVKIDNGSHYNILKFKNEFTYSEEIFSFRLNLINEIIEKNQEYNFTIQRTFLHAVYLFIKKNNVTSFYLTINNKDNTITCILNDEHVLNYSEVLFELEFSKII